MGAMGRRDFLRRAGLFAGAAVAAPKLVSGAAFGAAPDRAGRIPVLAPESMLDRAAAEAPFDTVVVVVMENRSFDHFFGWLGSDAAYLAAGQARYGSRFRIDGRQDLTYRDPHGAEVATYWLPGASGRAVPVPGLRRRDPRARMGRGPGPARARVPGARQWQQLVRAGLLPGHRHALPRGADRPLHHL